MLSFVLSSSRAGRGLHRFISSARSCWWEQAFASCERYHIGDDELDREESRENIVNGVEDACRGSSIRRNYLSARLHE
jgi:hypothetical protein